MTDTFCSAKALWACFLFGFYFCAQRRGATPNLHSLLLVERALAWSLVFVPSRGLARASAHSTSLRTLWGDRWWRSRGNGG